MSLDSTLLHIALLKAPSAGGASALSRSPFGPFELHPCTTPEQLTSLLIAHHCDALILTVGVSAELEAAAVDAGTDIAMLVVVAGLDVPAIVDWQERGAQDVLLRAELDSPTLGARVRGAIRRKHQQREVRHAYSTDLETGLPHQQQFIEHVSQLLALREREPAPMAVLVLRVEGLATTEARLGRDSANSLRRKIGVRLRAEVRASDVVAALGGDNYAVLLGSILSPEDAPRVGAKLTKALMKPFKVAGQQVAITSALGIAQYPQDAAQPDALLRRAVGLAASATAPGRAGVVTVGEGGTMPPDAANDG